MDKIKVLINQQIIEPYRHDFYRELNKDARFDIIGFYHRKKNIPFDFPVLKGTVIGLKSFLFQRGYWSNVNSKLYDVIVAEFDLHLVSNIFLLFYAKYKKIPFIWWGIGYGKHNFIMPIKTFLVKKASAIIVYEMLAKEKLITNGVKEDKIFVKHNTIKIESPELNNIIEDRVSFLVIGNINRRKKIDELLVSFSKIIDKIDSRYRIDIIGDGSEIHSLKLIAKDLKIDKRVKFHGRILDEAKLKKYFHSSLAVVHPGQAGLSVLHAFAYGVPFVTGINSISGGEIENIEQNRTGYLYNGSIERLSSCLERLCLDPYLSLEMGRNAFKHYINNRRISNMAGNFLNAISYAFKNGRESE